MFKFTENSIKFLRSVTWRGSMTWKMFLVTSIYGRSFELCIWWTFALEFLLIAQWFPKLQSKIELSRPRKLFYSSFSPQPVTWFDKHKQSKLHNLPVGVNLPKIWLWPGYFPKVRKNDKKEKKSLNTLKAFFKNASLNTLYMWCVARFGISHYLALAWSFKRVRMHATVCMS